ncbi:MAG: response regulator, partial [Oscillochloris sp.]|nr:response regulator [Oscillochloris sp.]
MISAQTLLIVEDAADFSTLCRFACDSACKEFVQTLALLYPKLALAEPEPRPAYTIVMAATQAEALAAIQEHPRIGFVSVDLALEAGESGLSDDDRAAGKDAGGMHVLQALRQAGQTPPAVVVTGETLLAYAREAFQKHKVLAFFQKARFELSDYRQTVLAALWYNEALSHLERIERYGEDPAYLPLVQACWQQALDCCTYLADGRQRRLEISFPEDPALRLKLVQSQLDPVSGRPGSEWTKTALKHYVISGDSWSVLQTRLTNLATFRANYPSQLDALQALVLQSLKDVLVQYQETPIFLGVLGREYRSEPCFVVILQSRPQNHLHAIAKAVGARFREDAAALLPYQERHRTAHIPHLGIARWTSQVAHDRDDFPISTPRSTYLAPTSRSRYVTLNTNDRAMPDGSNLRLIVIDDDESWCTVLGHLVRAMNHTLDVAANLEEAKRKIHDAEQMQRPYAIAIVDMNFKFGGFELLQGEEIVEYIKANHGYMACVVASGEKVFPDDVLDLRDNKGLDYYLQKDRISIDKLRKAVQRSLERTRGAAGNQAPPGQNGVQIVQSAAPQAVAPVPDFEPPPRNQVDHVELEFQQQAHGVTITWRAPLIGREATKFSLPYTPDELPLVIRSLDVLQYPGYPDPLNEQERRHFAFSPPEQAILTRLNLWGAERIAGDSFQTVGRTLYHALGPDGQRIIKSVRNASIAGGTTTNYVLRFPADAIDLAALPWELLWDNERNQAILLRGNKIDSCRTLCRSRYCAAAAAAGRPEITRPGPVATLR